MPSVKYGGKTIEYSRHEKEGLKSHYISVDRHSGVVLKGKHVSPEKADKLVLKKAGWIIKKLEAVSAVEADEITTGSRIPYLGRSYYVELLPSSGNEEVFVEFNYSRFKIFTHKKYHSQEEIKTAIEDFYKEKAIEKITPRVNKLSTKTKLSFKQLSFRKMARRWGSCTPDNKIIINYHAIKLPYTLLDYLIIHELCHTKIKDHTKAYWAELSKHVPNWRELDERVKEVKM